MDGFTKKPKPQYEYFQSNAFYDSTLITKYAFAIEKAQFLRRLSVSLYMYVCHIVFRLLKIVTS